MKLHVIMDSHGHIVGTVNVSPGERIQGLKAHHTPEQSVYEIDIPDSEMPKEAEELHKKCEHAIKEKTAKKL